VPENAARDTDAAWQTWIKNGFASVAHPIDTAAMMKRSLGGESHLHLNSDHRRNRVAGVVDAQLKVHDTANVRIVDTSVIPLHISAPLSSTLYGVTADLIKAAQ
jgi:choline dehydrogenase-like flavoprotein